MRRINDFATVICQARKRTGVVLADETFRLVIKTFQQAGFTIVDAAELYEGKLFYTDDQLIDKLKLLVEDKSVLLVNLELFIAPRLADGNYVEQVARKLVVLEPRQPLALLFYSLTVYSTFSHIYQSIPLSKRHTLDLTEESPLYQA